MLFTGTVAANIRYGREESSDEEVRHAATVAQAIEFVDAMPETFESPISQGGVNLSGGQKQRLAIGRAIVRKPDVYVFDDSAALTSETVNATVFVVAQRISTVINADRIVVLDDGRVVAIGTHADLLETSVVYREVVASQVSPDRSGRGGVACSKGDRPRVGVGSVVPRVGADPRVRQGRHAGRTPYGVYRSPARYFSPESTATVATTLPGPNSRAISRAATTFSAEEVPANTPSSFPSRRAIARASDSFTVPASSWTPGVRVRRHETGRRP